MKDLKKRVISGIVGGALLVFILIKGGLLLTVSLFLMSIIGQREFFEAFKEKEIYGIRSVAYFWTGALYLNFIYELGLDHLAIVGITLSSLTGYLVLNERKIEDGAITILAFMYIPFLLSHLYYLSDGVYLWLVFIIAFGSDTFAYFAGNLFGKNKLSPTISPNKTVEGSIGGVIGSFVLTLIFSYLYAKNHMIKLLFLAVLGSLVSQSGDLVASKIKRYTGVKDYGRLIPGHGGILDRFDSIIVTTPVVYYFVRIFIK